MPGTGAAGYFVTESKSLAAGRPNPEDLQRKTSRMRRTARKSTPKTLILPNQSRRRFIQGLAAGGVMASLSPWLKPAWAEPAATTLTGAAPAMRGTQFDLTIAETPVNFTGTPRMATTINGSIPAPTLH